MERNVMYQNNQEPNVPKSQNLEAYQKQTLKLNGIYHKFSTLIGYINKKRVDYVTKTEIWTGCV